MTGILYPDEQPQVHRQSSIDQFGQYISIWTKGGWAPIVFDKLDSIGTCSGIKSHPAIISWDPIGYIYPEGHCTYHSDKFIVVDKYGVEQKVLPECMGEGFYETFNNSNSFIDFDAGTSLGVHQAKTLRVGLDLVKASDTLPAVD